MEKEQLDLICAIHECLGKWRTIRSFAKLGGTYTYGMLETLGDQRCGLCRLFPYLCTGETDEECPAGWHYDGVCSKLLSKLFAAINDRCGTMPVIDEIIEYLECLAKKHLKRR